jgi:hypothetical protein
MQIQRCEAFAAAAERRGARAMLIAAVVISMPYAWLIAMCFIVGDVPFNLTTLVGLLPLVALSWWFLHRLDRRRRYVLARSGLVCCCCGYDLSSQLIQGSAETTCPECGTRTTRDETIAIWNRRLECDPPIASN